MRSWNGAALENADYTDKLYAAYINSADQLVALGDKNQALSQLSKATELVPIRQQARDRELALTPTPVPPPPTPTPAVPPGLALYIGRVEPLVYQATTAVQTLRTSHLAQVDLDVISESEAVDKIQSQMDRDQLVAQDRAASPEQRAAARTDLRQQSLALPHAQVAALDTSKGLEALNGSADQKATAAAFAQVQQLARQLQDVGAAASGFEALDPQLTSFDDDLAYIADEFGTGLDAMSTAHISARSSECGRSSPRPSPSWARSATSSSSSGSAPPARQLRLSASRRSHQSLPSLMGWPVQLRLSEREE